MITAVDTNILLDVLVPDARHADESEEALAEAVRAGAVTLSEAAYAELAGYFPAQEELDRFLADTGMTVRSSSAEALFRAGRSWSEYSRRRPAGVACPQCGSSQNLRCDGCEAPLSPRQHVLADFLIGAHALYHADRLLTRDRGYYHRYFPELTLMSGSAGPLGPLSPA